MASLHIVPRGDRVEHDTSTDDATCICGPQLLPMITPDGATSWIYSHHSLDGRERFEVKEDGSDDQLR